MAGRSLVHWIERCEGERCLLHDVVIIFIRCA